jgi:hypothetical protein
MFDCLCALAQLGAFTPDGGRAAAVWESDGTISGTVWRRSLSVGDIDGSFWKVLLQMCVQCHYHLAPICRLSIRDGNPHGPLAAVWDPLSAPPLAAPRQLPFRLVKSEDAPGDIVAVRATTAMPIDDQALGDLKKAFEDWGSLVYVGGFAGADAPLDEYQLERVEVGRLHDALVECAAIGWNAPLAAIDCLLRVCKGLHSNVIPIDELEIE